MQNSQFRRVERQARRMHEMIERLDVDAGKLVRLNQGDTYASARRRCLDCCETESCLKWLELPESVEDAPEFCPNIDLFEMIGKRRG